MLLQYVSYVDTKSNHTEFSLMKINILNFMKLNSNFWLKGGLSASLLFQTSRLIVITKKEPILAFSQNCETRGFLRRNELQPMNFKNTSHIVFYNLMGRNTFHAENPCQGVLYEMRSMKFIVQHASLEVGLAVIRSPKEWIEL